MSRDYLFFDSEVALVQGLLETLNSQYEYVPEGNDQNAYYDWIYWVLDKALELKGRENGN